MQSFDPEDIRVHQVFLRRLARRLVRDEHSAEDLVQETWVMALEAPAGWVRRMRPWLTTVMRHLAINRSASDDRRRRRERESARSEIDERGLELDERLATQARLLQALRQVPEPHRRALYLRYADGMGPTRIARELELPLPTVKSRLARGRELLRQRLDEDFGERASWCTALAPSLALRELGPASGLGWVGMVMSWKAVAAIAALGLCGVYLLSKTESIAPVGPDLARDSVNEANSSPPPREERDLPASESEIDRRSASVQAEAHDNTPLAVVEANPTVHGRLIDARALPIPGLTVAQVDRSGDVLAKSSLPSAADGTFELVPNGLRGQLHANDAGWVTLLASHLTAAGARESHTIVIAPARRLAGRVIDTDGRAIAAAQVGFHNPEGLRRRFDQPLERTLSVAREVRSDAFGRFELLGGELRGSTLLAAAEGFVSRVMSLDGLNGERLEVILRRPGEMPDSIHGWVIDRAGWPVEGAYVSFGADRVRSDEAGRFHLPRESDARAYERVTAALGGPSRTLRAVHPDHLPGHLEVPTDPDTRAALWPDGLVLELGGTPLSIEGRVVNEGGAAVENARVWLKRSTYFSADEGGCSVEALMGAGPGERHLMTRSEADGRFRLDGLLDQHYVVVAAHPDSFQQVHSEELPAGSTNVTLVLDSAGAWKNVQGRLRARDGEPLAGVDIQVMADVAALYLQGEFVRTSSWLVNSAVGDGEGRFALATLPKRHAYLFVNGSAVMTERVPVEDLGDADADELEGVEIVLLRRVHVRVTLDGTVSADELSILDEEREPLGLQVFEGKPSPPRTRMPFHGARSDILSVADSGRVLVLYRDGVEVARRAIALRAGEVNEL